MVSFVNKLSLFFCATRAYSLPISVMSWLVPFLLGLFNKGNIIYGIFSLLGIIILHLATNIFDDTIDYKREEILIKRGLKDSFNFQKGKCSCIFEGLLSLKQYYTISFYLFLTALIIALIFISLCGLKLLYIIIPCIILCLLYPILGCLGLGEIIVAIIFSPLIYSGVYFVMTKSFSADVLLISISTGLLSVAVLHNHMLLDYKFDTSNRKITLCRIVGNEKKSLFLLGIIIFLSYFNIFLLVWIEKLNNWYMITLISLPYAISLIRIMSKHIKNPYEDDFLTKFKLPQNLLTYYTILLCIAIILSERT